MTTSTPSTKTQRDALVAEIQRETAALKAEGEAIPSVYLVDLRAQLAALDAPQAVASTPSTKTQQRAICPACFAQQAITRGGRLVAHGYKRPQMWHANVGTCSGAGEPHYGTPAGRDYTTAVAQRLRIAAINADVTAQRVDARVDAEPVLARKRLAGGVYTMATVDAPTDAQRAAYARELVQQAVAMRASADELDARVATWTPAEPVEVAVEVKTTLLHMRRGDRWGGKLCAASAMAAHKGYTTSDAARVTCDKCKARMARLQERAAQ